MEVMIALDSKLGWQDAPVGREMWYGMGAIEDIRKKNIPTPGLDD